MLSSILKLYISQCHCARLAYCSMHVCAYRACMEVLESEYTLDKYTIITFNIIWQSVFLLLTAKYQQIIATPVSSQHCYSYS